MKYYLKHLKSIDLKCVKNRVFSSFDQALPAHLFAGLKFQSQSIFGYRLHRYRMLNKKDILEELRREIQVSILLRNITL